MTVIVLNWNCAADTIFCVNLLESAGFKAIVVDNGSENPNEANLIRLAIPNLTVLDAKKNLGYAGGMNMGMKWSLSHGYTHSLLLNPDTIPTQKVIDAMLRISAGAAVVGTAQGVLDSNGNIQAYTSAAMLVKDKPVAFRCKNGCAKGHEVDIVSGAALLLDLEIAQDLGYMDERYFHYKEEFDFVYRAGKTGRKIMYSCAETLDHKRGGSLPIFSPIARYYNFRNEILFLTKHFGPLGWIKGPRIFSHAFLVMVESPRSSFMILRGLCDGILGVSGPLIVKKRWGVLR